MQSILLNIMLLIEELRSLYGSLSIIFQSKIEDVVLDEEKGFVTYIIIDIDEYARLHGNKAVKKTVTLPNYLNTLAEKENINFSQVLQESLKEKLLH